MSCKAAHLAWLLHGCHGYRCRNCPRGESVIGCVSRAGDAFFWVDASRPEGARRTLASRVFPHPGGPVNKTPAGAVSPRTLNCSGKRTGA